ncbi:MAG: hypothetical protein EBR28_03745 [Planctomycetia bacterium]|nr:hypothetical protein [Planctomycetia bacterium]
MECLERERVEHLGRRSGPHGLVEQTVDGGGEHVAVVDDERLDEVSREQVEPGEIRLAVRNLRSPIGCGVDVVGVEGLPVTRGGDGEADPERGIVAERGGRETEGDRTRVARVEGVAYGFERPISDRDDARGGLHLAPDRCQALLVRLSFHD